MIEDLFAGDDHILNAVRALNRILIISSLTDADPIEDRYIGDLADSAEIYLNGKRIGTQSSGRM